MSTSAIAPFFGTTQTNPDSNNESTSTSMRLLPFRLNDFTRISWVSDSARNVWEPRIHRISNAWIEIEWLAIIAGIRSCCITMASPEQFVERGPIWVQHGLNALPVSISGLGTHGYSSTPVAVEHGKPFVFRLVLGSPKHVSEFKAAWDDSDDRGIGKLLGYPTCCREFFKRVWVDQGLVDTTWPMAVATDLAEVKDTLVEVNTPPKSNILWRWMGVRAVSHLPCCFNCQATIEIADRFIEVGRNHGFDQEMNWLLQIHDWPVEWSVLHGIAEIKTPILKVSTRTDATFCKYTVRYKGNSYPAEGAKGLRFPYSAPSLSILTESPSFKRGLVNPIGEQSPESQWYARDNGFSSVVEMDRSHEPIVETASTFLTENSGMVLDLGCGNGALMKKLLDVNPSIVPFGIDSDASRIAHAQELLPEFTENFVVGDIFENESAWFERRRYGLALLMPGRLLEVDSDRAEQLRLRLQEQCDRVLIYAYGDWLTRYETLKDLAVATGFELLGTEENVAAGFAKVIDPRCEDKVADGKPSSQSQVAHTTLQPETSTQKSGIVQRDESKIDWKRMAQPQPDQYDTNITLRYAAANGYVSSPVQAGDVSRSFFFDGDVKIRGFQRKWVEGCSEARLDHPNIQKVTELLRLWPEVYVQFKSLVERVYLFVETHRREDYVVGSICGPGSEGFGSIATTITHHVGFAEALVHEMAHHKLRELGVDFESSHRILTNPPDQKYRSPIRYDCLRPMSAVLHAQYSYTYIAALDIKIVQNTTDRERNSQIVSNSLALIIPKLEFGLSVIKEHAIFDDVGREFMEGLYSWSECIISDAKQLFQDFSVSPKPFTHPQDKS